MQHVRQIKSALQVAGVSSVEFSYIVKGDKNNEGMQMGWETLVITPSTLSSSRNESHDYRYRKD